MTHPLIPQILELAAPIAQRLNLELAGVVYQTNKNPPILRVDIRNLNGDTSLEDCEGMSRALEERLDATELIANAYVLEISSPGLSRQLTTERDFITFKGFSVLVKTQTPFKKKKEWQGRLQGRDETNIYLNQKGRPIAIPREAIAEVELWDKEEG
ncbi:MAG: ribosome maturation factor RimP [Cyanobacteria bacterium SBLK]|nr:ribosome maturation factor RimP [Cyanobacteria bacterium SBLK]